MCRAMKVLCVATDEASLATLRSASVSADWELTGGATNQVDALGLIDVERPQVVVAFGPYEDMVCLVSERFPGIRIVTDRDAPGATAIATSVEQVRELVRGLPAPGGPVR
jgi:hypothetical protein